METNITQVELEKFIQLTALAKDVEQLLLLQDYITEDALRAIANPIVYDYLKNQFSGKKYTIGNIANMLVELKQLEKLGPYNKYASALIYHYENKNI